MNNFLRWLKVLHPMRSLVAQISYATALVTLLLTVALSYYAAEISRLQIEHEQGENFARRAQSIVDLLDRGMFERTREIQLVAELDEIRNPNIRVEKKRTILEKMQQTFNAYAWIGICDAQGIGTVGTGKYLEGVDLSKRPWCRQGREKPFVGDVHDALLLSKLLPNPSGEMFYLVDVAAPIINAVGSLQGVLCGHIFWRWAEEFLDSKNSPGIDILLLNGDGLVLSGPLKGRSQFANMAPATWKFIKSNRSKSEQDYLLETWTDGKRYLMGHAHDAGYREYPGLGWVAVVRQDAEIAFAPARALQHRILLAGIVLGLLFTLIGAILARRIAKPISKMADAANKIAEGDLEYDAPQVSGTGEVAQLARSIHTMVSNLTNEIHDRKQAEQHIQKLANFDTLTGLPNRLLLNDRVGQSISVAQRDLAQVAVLFVDLDHFKIINDTLGHHIGDKLLVQAGNRLLSSVREMDTVARIGGDEFVIVLSSIEVDGVAHVATKLLETISQPFRIEQHELVVTPSIGIAIYPEDGKDFDTLYQHADVAMYRAKKDGRNNYRFFTHEMQAHSVHSLQIENSLRFALQRGQLYLNYQPQINIADGKIIGAEALLRWQHPELGMVSPAEFIQIAEHNGQIIEIGEWVIRTAVQQLKTWLDKGLPPMIMAVNLSAVQFRHANLPELITNILDEAHLPAQYLELELTEGVAMDDPQGAIGVMDKLHELGVRMSIDDFGTGYSSLSYLKRFKVYKLKIDQSFVRDISEDADDRAIVTAIIQLAHSLNFQTIAEGVETEVQLAFLREQGCGEVQGYHFSKPLSPEQFEAFATLKKYR